MWQPILPILVAAVAVTALFFNAKSSPTNSTPFANYVQAASVLTPQPVRTSTHVRPWSSVFSDGTPLVFRSLLRDWTAVNRWSPSYLGKKWKRMKVHTTEQDTTRMLSKVQPFGREKQLQWSASYDEKVVAGSEFFNPNPTNSSDRMYLFAPVEELPPALQKDFQGFNLAQLGTPGNIDSAGFWSGRPTIASPLHYDAAHNVYCQIFGYKRFILFPHNVSQLLYSHSRLHPSTRSSFINLRHVDPSRFSKFKQALDNNTLYSSEVVLGPGDVLYIPPYTWHRASVVGTDFSMSLAVYSTSTIMHQYDVLKSYPVPIDPTWLWNRKVAALKTYVCALASMWDDDDDDPAVTDVSVCSARIANLLEQRYAPLSNDPHKTNIIQGWDTFIKVGQRHFLWSTAKVKVPPEVELYLVQHAATLKKKLTKRSSKEEGEEDIARDVWTTETLSLIEDVVNYVVGSKYVEPFFRWVAGDLMLW